jgi:membrane protease YdiL (CAAX protease family)
MRLGLVLTNTRAMSTNLSTIESQVRSAPASRTAGRRWLSAAQAAGFTGAWVGTGLALDLDGRVYVAMGIPFVIAFQLLVRRRPLRDLWVRDGDPFRLDRRGRRIAMVLVAYPLIAMAIFLVQDQGLNALMAGCAVPGAFAAAYAIRRQDTRTWHPALRAALLATVIGLGWMVALIVPAIDHDASVLGMVARGLHSLLLYLPVAFVLEEVAFRGAVDAHVHHPGESWGWLSAVYVSVLWALWHVPIDIGSEPLTDLVIGLLLIHVSIGVPLSYAWRRSGNLALPAAVHAVIDAVRDGLYSGT